MSVIPEEPILVTGANGFIGRHLVDRLLAKRRKVRALVLPGEETPALWNDDVAVTWGDVTDRSAVESAVADSRTVIHLVALVGDWGKRERFNEVTVGGTHHVLAAAADADARVVLASSVVVYGDAIGREVCHEDRPFGRPLGVYSESKQAQEALAWRVAETRGLRLTVVRPTNVFGPGSGPWVHEACRRLRMRVPCLIDGGNNNAGLCTRGNVVDGLMRAASVPEAVGKAYNISDGSDITWRRYFSDLAQISGAPRPWSMPGGVVKWSANVSEWLWRTARLPGGPLVTREALNLVGSHFQVPIDRARDDLGYAPATDSYENEMKAIAADLQPHGQ